MADYINKIKNQSRLGILLELRSDILRFHRIRQVGITPMLRILPNGPSISKRILNRPCIPSPRLFLILSPLGHLCPVLNREIIHLLGPALVLDEHRNWAAAEILRRLAVAGEGVGAHETTVPDFELSVDDFAVLVVGGFDFGTEVGDVPFKSFTGTAGFRADGKVRLAADGRHFHSVESVWELTSKGN